MDRYYLERDTIPIDLNNALLFLKNFFPICRDLSYHNHRNGNFLRNNVHLITGQNEAQAPLRIQTDLEAYDVLVHHQYYRLHYHICDTLLRDER